ncbi:MAG: T9SS type A sorting domain-containing protein [Owenweeksia sp.]
MKKLYTLCLMLLLGGAVSAQYYLLPAFDAGNNPGNLNDDPEQPTGGGVGWTNIMGTTTVDTWSSAQTIPFSFDFNGSAVSSYMISNTGVLTFAASPGPVPGSTPSALPSVLIPNKSVCVWGLSLTGVNDAILSKTFGNAPNRQHWIMFASASHANFTGTSQWTYWSIVLEETTNSIYVVDQRTYDGNGTTPTGNNVALTVGINVSAANVLQVTASPNVSSNTLATSGVGADPSDNTWYEFAYGTQVNYDLAGISYDVLPLVQTASPVNIDLTFRNRGAFSVNSLDLNYRINGGAAVTSSISSLSIGSGDFYSVTHPTAWTPSADGSYTIEAWASNINGNADGVNSNDTITFKVSAVANPPQRVVVIEEKTGTWCGWCPRGLIGMDDITKMFPNTVAGIAVHNADPMVVTGYDGNAFIGLVAPGGYPGSAVDRILGPDPNTADLQAAYAQRQDVAAVADVDIDDVDYNEASGQISVDVSAEFFADFDNTDLRFLMVLTEDSVHGTTSGYAQVNYYSSASQNIALNGYGRNWQTSPAVIPASEMKYDHVARGIYPNFFGDANSVPANVSFGQQITHTLTATLPTSVLDDDKVHVIVMLVNNDTYEVMNAKSTKLKGSGNVSLNELNASSQLSVYPNPASDQLYINVEDLEGDIEVQLVNGVGQAVMAQQYNTDSAKLIELNTSNFVSGVYILTVKTNDQSFSQRISIVK